MTDTYISSKVYIVIVHFKASNTETLKSFNDDSNKPPDPSTSCFPYTVDHLVN